MSHDRNDPKGNQIEQASNDLIQAAKRLESLGLSRTSIHNLIRHRLPASNYEETLRQASIAHIEMMLEVLQGADAGEVRAARNLSNVGRKAVLNLGARKIYKTLDIHTKYIQKSGKTPLDPQFRDYWTELGHKALARLKNDGE